MAKRNIDDVYKRKKYKDAQYNGKKSRKDDYTGERVFRGRGQSSLYKHPLSKTSDTDHITPIKVVEKRYPSLTETQKKTLVNDEKHNYATISSKLNRSKGDLENHEYLIRQIKKGEPEDLGTSARMLAKELDSRVYMDATATRMYVQNAAGRSKELMRTAVTGTENALTVSAIPLAIFATQNVVAVANNEKTLAEAAKDVGAMAGKVAVTGGATELVFKAFVKPAPDKVVAHMTKIGNINQIGNVIIVAELIARTTVRYLNGDISGEEFFYNIGSDAVGMASGILAHKLFVMCALPGPMLASMIGSAVCSEIYAQANKLRQEKKDNREIREIAEAASAELKVQQEKLHWLMEKNHAQWVTEMDMCFQKIAVGLVESNVSQINQNLRKLAKCCSLYENGDEAIDDLLTGRKTLHLLGGDQ